MKKIVLLIVTVIMGLSANAQQSGFTAGVHTGLPVGDYKFGFSVNFGLDIAYLWSVSDSFSLGVTTGYTHYVGKDVNNSYYGSSYRFDDGGFVPVAVSYRVAITDFLFAGTDLGYARYILEGGGGGFYFQPKLGYSMEKIDVFASYKGIVSNGTNLATIGVGAAYKF